MTGPRVVVVGSESVVLAGLVGFLTAGFGLFCVWPVQMLWAKIAASNDNKGQVARVQRQLR